MSARVEVSRGRLLESVHHVHAVVVGPSGIELLWGDPEHPTTLRSVAKLFQALPLVEDGVADALPLSGSELALCCASHNTEPTHVETARAILAKAGVAESDLACGPHSPMDAVAARGLRAAGVEPGPIHNNCSGKHAGMLALAVHHGWPTEEYHQPDHPVQRRMAQEVARWSGLEPDAVPTGVDGCGIPCYGLPLERLARAFQRFAEAEAAGRLLDAIGGAPFMIGGTGRLCTRLPEVTGGRIVAKIGAEGVYGAVDRERGRGIALKVEDGARRAVEPALLGVLEATGSLSADELAALEDFRSPPVTNTRDEVVGRMVCVGAPAASDVRTDARPASRLDGGLAAIVRLSAAMAAGAASAVDEALRDAARHADPVEVEEAILQSYLFLGFPAALNTFAAWRRVSGVEAPGPSDPAGEEDGLAARDPLAAWQARGEDTCARVYGGAYDALRINIARLKPELDHWMILEGYGKVLGRPGLSLDRRECCIVAMLAVGDLPVQLRSHMRGALRCGADPATIDEVLDLVAPLTAPGAFERAREVRDAVLSTSEV